MPLPTIAELLAGLRRDETAVRPADKAHKESRPPLTIQQQPDAAVIALLTAQANGLIH